jgi:hypothetical protein
MQIVVKAQAVLAHARIQGVFPGVAKRRVTNVVNQGQCFGEVFIQTQSHGGGARQLRHLNRVRQPVAEMNRVAFTENLSLVFQTPERPAVDDAIPVALKFGSVGMPRLGVPPSETG